MFGLFKRNRPIIPTRLPESVDPPIPKYKAMKQVPIIKVPEEPPVAEESAENVETPPLTPSSDTAEVSTDEPSVEEPTVEEKCKVAANTDQMKNKTGEGEESSDEAPDSETFSESDEDENKPKNRVGFKLFTIWIVFWSVALAGGVFAYYFNIHQQIVAGRLGGDIETANVHLLLTPREKWDDSTNVAAKPSSYTAQRVVVLQTDTETCDTIPTCSRLLNAMNIRQQKRKEGGILKYNFLIATDGYIYEALGWQEPSPLYPDTLTMVVAFIGNYETVAPSTMQLTQFQALLEASEELNYLANSYTILGRKETVVPSKLFAYISAFKNWDKENSETDETYIDVEFDPFPMFND